MNNPFQITFTLKQHTPIIHFQHDQDGATLRASEVKPKLDRFILTKLGAEADQSLVGNDAKYKKGKEVAKKGNWLVGDGEHAALNYKISIIAKPNKTTIKSGIKLINEEGIDLKNSCYNPDIKVTILTIISTLKHKIEDIIEDFFVLHSFGNRQNKGWGCFYHENTKSFDKVKAILQRNSILAFDSNENNVTIDNFYSIISKKWRILKSGVNFPANPQRNFNGQYKKALVFKYSSSMNLRWDKRWMKKEIKNLIPTVLPKNLKGRNAPNDIVSSQKPCSDFPSNNIWEDKGNAKYRFVRALLGLPELIEFRAFDNYVYQVIVKSNNVDRCQASVIFKLFDKKLYAMVFPLPNEIYDTPFSFKVKTKEGREQVGHVIDIQDANGIKELHTPSTHEFSLNKFLSDYFPCIGFNLIKYK